MVDTRRCRVLSFINCTLVLLETADGGTARSSALVCGCWCVGIAGSNSSSNMDVCLLCVLCIVR